MNFRARGIIIYKKPIKEHHTIVTIFTDTHGIYSGVSRNKKQNNNLLEANLVDVFWNARLDEHIGYVKTELIQSYHYPIILNKTKLYAFNSIISLLRLCFCERESHNRLYSTLLHFIQSQKNQFSYVNYIKMELAILSEAGYGLQLTECAVTKSNKDLYYVSPKSGNAISYQAGKNYDSKLLKLPKFLINYNVNNDMSGIHLSCLEEITRQNIDDAFKLTSYFLNRYILTEKRQPISRLSFIEHAIN